MREIDDISDAFWECVLYSGESAVGFSFIFSFGATLNNFFLKKRHPFFFVFFARRGCSLISLSLLSFFLFFFGDSSSVHAHTRTRARVKRRSF